MKLLVISPHPDDETLGACGTVMHLISRGVEAIWLNITNMRTEYGYPAPLVEKRAEEIQRVKEATGYSQFYDLGLKPAALETYEKGEMITSIKKVFDKEQPELVFLPSPHDAHSDHRVVYECAIPCTKTFRAPYVRKVFCMDIISETEYGDAPFSANCFVDISAYMERKIKISEIYGSEFLSSPFPRSKEKVRAQAQYRGAACCAEYAEAFQIVKEIIL
jgi:LmbE family N-acetylglucosaminyl deacetylase